MSNKNIAKNYIYNLIYQITIIILPLITTPYISRVLGSDGVGTYSFTLSIVTYFILFGTLGVAMYGQREIAYLQSEKEKRSKAFLEIVFFRAITLVISMIIFYFTFGVQGQYSLYYKIFLIEIFANIFDISWFFQGLEDFKKTVTRNMIVKIISVICIFTFVKSSNDLWIYILIYVLSTLLGNLSLWAYIPKYITLNNLGKLNIFRHLKPTISLFIPQIAIQVYTVLDRTMIGVMVPNISEVGFFEQSQKIVKMALAIITALGTVMSPRIANTYANNKKDEVKEYLSKSFRFAWFLGCPIMFGIIAVSNNLVPWFYGDGYEKVKILLMILSPLILAIGLNNVTGIQYLIQIKKQNIFTITVIIGSIVNVVLNLLLISVFQSVGAAISSVVAEIVIFLVQLLYIKEDFDVKEIFKLSFKYLISGMIMFLTVFTIGEFLPATIIGTSIQILIGSIIYVLALVILRDKFIWTVSTKILQKIKSK
jgi:O-antigen/teichoic acid export membrane protein